LDCAVKYDLIKKSGAWYSYNEEKIGQGRDNAREYLEQNPGLAKELETKLRAQIFPGREFPKPAVSSAQASKGEQAAKSEPAAKKTPEPDKTQEAESSQKAEAAAETAPVYQTAPASPGRGRPKKAAASDDGLF
jgi:recombination protein RecA